jgi:hypothetical protein
MTKYDKTVLRALARKHVQYFSSVSVWNEFAIKNNYPRAATFSYHFGGWNNFKSEVFGQGQELNMAFSQSFTVERLKEIAVSHKERFTKMNTWDEFATKNNIPSAKVFIHTFGTWNKAKREILGEDVKLNRDVPYDGEKLTSIAVKYKSAFTSVNVWNEFAKEKDLPSSKVYEKFYGSWNKAKQSIFNPSSSRVHKKPESLSIAQLCEIAVNNHKYFSTKKNWDLHAMKNKLPRAETFANRFGSWKKAKLEIDKIVQR